MQSDKDHFQETPLPPKWLRNLASFICAPHLREELTGDLEERYALRYKRGGQRKAQFWYVREIFSLFRFSIIKRKKTSYPSIPLFRFEMLKNYLKIGSRVLIKNKGYSFIHITGLAIGLWACMMVATVVIDSLSYDKHWSRANDIYRIISADNHGGSTFERISSSHAGLARELQKLYPEVEAWSEFSTASLYFKRDAGDPSGIETQVLNMDTAALNMLDFKILTGNPAKFQPGNNNLIVTKSYANTFFPGQEVVGKIIFDVPRYGSSPNPYLITGVINDLPYNSHLRADVIRLRQNRVEPFSASGFATFAQNYIMLKRGSNVEAFSKKVNNWHRNLAKENTSKQIQFQPLSEIYLHSDFAQGQKIKADAKNIYIFSGIAALLLFIACVNFINLSTAKAFARLKEAGVRRILSGSRSQLVMQLLTETLILFAAAFAIAIVGYQLSITAVEQFLGHRLIQTFTSGIQLAGYALLTIAVTALLTGLYPAWLISGFKPSNSLKGILSASMGQNRLRKSLVVVQFSISIAVLLATIVVWQQLDLLENKDLGYEKKHLLSIDHVSWDGKGEAFKNEILRIPAVSSASTTLWLPSQGGGFMTKEIPDPANSQKRVKVWFIAGDVDLPKTLGLELVKGRMFSNAYATDAVNADSLQKVSFEKYEQAFLLQTSLVTASAAKMLGMKELNQQIPSTKTVPVGVVRDFYNESLYEPIKPTLIMAQRNPQYGGMLIRVLPGAEYQVAASIEKLWKNFYPAKLLELNQVKDLLDAQYESETRLHQLFIFFSALTMFLSALGIFGLVVQVAEQRSREVGIRKVLGASVSGLVALLSMDFIKLVTIAIMIASPVAWFGLTRWLETYPYRTEISWWIFLITGAGALLITLFTISFQALRTALVDPVKSLKNE